METKKSDTETPVSMDNNNLKQLYANIIETKNENDENLVCDLCLDNNSYQGNALVVCELCLSAVH